MFITQKILQVLEETLLVDFFPSCDLGVTNASEGDEKPTWTSWQQWSSCDVTCGGGIQFRSRRCTDSKLEEHSTCVGKPSDQQRCSEWNCPGSYKNYSNK